MSQLRLTDITKYYNNHKVIDNLSLEIKSGEFVTLLGPSGCGKTTLLRMIAGLEPIEKGKLEINGKLFNNISPQKRRIAMVFQSYALFPHMSVQNNILFGLKIRKVAQSKMHEKLSWVVRMLGLNGLEKRLPREISGGQRQRVAFARALVLDPEVLLLDEPLSNLDAALREMAMEELKRVHRQVGKTIIYVTHNQAEAMTMSERIAILNAGRLEQYDTPRNVYDYPHTIFSAEFIGSPAINGLSGTLSAKGDLIGVQTPVGFIILDREKSEKSPEYLGMSVYIGIRPQNIYLADANVARRYSDTQISLLVDLIENMGDRNLVIGRTDKGTVLRFLVSRDESIKLDQKVSVFIDGRNVHVFDPETRVNILE